jgi:hypothetical protein
MAGSYLFAEWSGVLKRTVEQWGDRGPLTLPEALHIPRGAFVALLALALTAGLIALEKMFPR